MTAKRSENYQSRTYTVTKHRKLWLLYKYNTARNNYYIFYANVLCFLIKEILSADYKLFFFLIEVT